MAETLDQYCTYVGAAELAGCTEGAIRAAVGRGELVPEQSSNDPRVRLLRVDRVKAWASVERKPGRKPAKHTEASK